MAFDGIVPKNEHVKIYHEKYSQLAKYCVTLNNMFNNRFKETEYTDVIFFVPMTLCHWN